MIRKRRSARREIEFQRPIISKSRNRRAKSNQADWPFAIAHCPLNRSETAGKLKEFGLRQFLGAHCAGVEAVYRIFGETNSTNKAIPLLFVEITGAFHYAVRQIRISKF